MNIEQYNKKRHLVYMLAFNFQLRPPDLSVNCWTVTNSAHCESHTNRMSDHYK